MWLVWLAASGSATLATDKPPKVGYWDATALLQVCAKQASLVELQNYSLVFSEHKALGSCFYRNKTTHFFKQKYQHPETLYHADR